MELPRENDLGQIINIDSSNQKNKENSLTTVRKTKKLSVLQTALAVKAYQLGI